MRTAECKALENIGVALESIGMRTTECKTLENIIGYYQECGNMFRNRTMSRLTIRTNQASILSSS